MGLRVMLKVIVYGYLCGISSTQELEGMPAQSGFMRLLEGQKAPDHATIARFWTGRCREAIEDLFYQYVRKQEMGEIFIDGTKIKSCADRDTFA